MKRILFLFIISFYGHFTYSQRPLIESSQWSLFLGSRDLLIEELPMGQNLNFINYLPYWPYSPIEAPYMGFSTQLLLRNGLEIDLRIFSNDDIFPVAGKFSVQHYFSDLLGISMGMFAYHFFTSKYLGFHTIGDKPLEIHSHFLTSYNLYDLGFKIAPVLRFENRTFTTSFRLNLGLSGFVPFTDIINQFKPQSNFRRVIRYNTHYDLQFFMLPDLRVGVNLLHIRNSVIGIQVLTNYMISRRSLNYTRSTYNWDFTNPIIETINNPKHRFHTWNIDFGLFLRFNSGQ
jgi:hypothetical protein